MSQAKNSDLPARIVRLISSYGLMVVVLFFLLILTLLGTLEQRGRGIFDVVESYFTSPFVVHYFGPVPVPLPGGYLLMVILFLNLLVGAIIKARKDWRHPGMLIAHAGMLLLLIAGMVSTHYSVRGYMQLSENEQSGEIRSFTEWTLELAEVGSDGRLAPQALVVGGGELEGIRRDEQRVFQSPELPFDVYVNGYARNARPGRERPGAAGKAIDGFVLQPLKPEMEVERNLPGAYLAFHAKDSEDVEEGILWGAARAPLVFTIGGKKWAAQFVKAKWEIPFVVRLDDAVGEWHPGSGIPRAFESHITKIEDGVEEKIRIYMNHPLRHRGYTFFQRNFEAGQQGVTSDISVFDVVKNPADQWPLYSLIIVGVGLLVHFVQKLAGYLKRSRVQRAAA
ncbi:MAG: cytochrome c biogenesis protein ResB [Verrucomicrobiales bacterium]